MIVRTGSYMYSDGDGQTARDPLNHALPLLFFAPNATKSGIRVAIASTHNTHWRGGRIPKATYGFGLGFAVGNDQASAHDRDAWCCYPSDLELWILQAAVRYVLTHRDWAFLTESVRSTWGEIKVADALWRISHHLLEVPSAQGGVGLGPHGLLKVLTMDYNDGILLGPNNSMNVHLVSAAAPFASSFEAQSSGCTEQRIRGVGPELGHGGRHPPRLQRRVERVAAACRAGAGRRHGKR